MNKDFSIRSLVIIVTAMFVLLPASRQTLVSAQSQEVIPSALPAQARDFDFWLGNWRATITGVSGQFPNVITSFGLGGGIAILESFAGGTGTSVSVYNVKEQKWYQIWFDTDQLLIEVTGEFKNGRMVLDGQETRPTGAKFVSRETWFNIANDRYEFTYDVSPDGGQTFQNALSARFARDAASSAALSELTPASADSQNLVPSALPSSFRQFDFLPGNWQVTSADCPSGGSSAVTLFGQGGGIALLEDLRCGDSYRNTSIAFYHGPSGKWRQTSLDTRDSLVELSGSRQSNEMVLEGEFTDPQSGQTLLGRTTFYNITASDIDRKFEVSEDNGQSWTTRETLHYAKTTVLRPLEFRARKVKAGKVILAWTDNSPGENRFEILRFEEGQWVVAKTAEANTDEIVMKRLESATTYGFAIRACDANRCSEQSEITVTTR